MNTVSGRKPKRPYHHGDLPAALLAAAEAILESDGIQELTLRAVARAVGVSHAAPKNHFGDLTGLLSELAASGFNRFRDEMARALATAGDRRESRARALGQAYFAFARQHRGLFTLMFRGDRLDPERPALRAAIEMTRQWRDALATATHDPAPDGAPGGSAGPPADAMVRATALWSLIHGYASLLLDGRLQGIVEAMPGDHPAEALLSAAISRLCLDP